MRAFAFGFHTAESRKPVRTAIGVKGMEEGREWIHMRVTGYDYAGIYSVAPDLSSFLWRYSTSCHFIRSFGAGLGWLKALEITVRRKGGMQISPGYGHGLPVVLPRNHAFRIPCPSLPAVHYQPMI